MTTAVEICAYAFGLLRKAKITSFEDGTVEATAAADVYPALRDAVLAAHPWNFAMDEFTPAKDAAEPLDGQASFPVQAGILRVWKVYSTAAARPIPFKRRRSRIIVDCDAITVIGLLRVPEAEFPPYFVRALAWALAAELGPRFAESAAKWEGIERKARDQMALARHMDAQEGDAPVLQDASLIEGR